MSLKLWQKYKATNTWTAPTIHISINWTILIEKQTNKKCITVHFGQNMIFPDNSYSEIKIVEKYCK